jgi:hypothetical protein
MFDSNCENVVRIFFNRPKLSNNRIHIFFNLNYYWIKLLLIYDNNLAAGSSISRKILGKIFPVTGSFRD